jgi:hypothetical protein
MKHEQTHFDRTVKDWYELQKRVYQFEEIEQDQMVISRVRDNNWTVDLDLAHKNLKSKLADRVSQTPDIFILSDIEISKLPLEYVMKIVDKKFQRSRYGGYFALLSYYLNSKIKFDNLGESYKNNIDTVVRKFTSYAGRVENYTTMNDYPIEVLNKRGDLLEGSNYIFVHGNVKYWIWK